MTKNTGNVALNKALLDLIVKQLQIKRGLNVKKTFILGIYGPQGSGKTTLSAQLVEQLRLAGFNTEAVSQDDFYASKQERLHRASTIHPLLATRGVPGTHDLGLALSTFQAAIEGKPFKVPQFDKSIDDQQPEPDWRTIEPSLDVLILEGWCVGVPDILHQNLKDHPQPYNELEKNQDIDGQWRRHVAEQNALYQEWYNMIDFLIGFSIPAFENIIDWRWQQECDLLQQQGRQFFQSKAQVSDFVAYFERITRVAQDALPEFADCIIDVDASHSMRVRG